MFPSSGRNIPKLSRILSEADYASTISRALKAEVGWTRASIKTVMRWTGSSDRTARNWINGVVGPSGRHLIALLRESNVVLGAVLELCERQDLSVAVNIDDVEIALKEAMGAVEALKEKSRAFRGSK